MTPDPNPDAEGAFEAWQKEHPPTSWRWLIAARNVFLAGHAAATASSRAEVEKLRAALTEKHAKIAEVFGRDHSVVTPRSKTDNRLKTRFTSYEVDQHVRAACRMVAEDIRASISKEWPSDD